ncbi:MAG TPA: hypothetical protein VEQ65_14375, partial [Opitutus sp.]|nr:hypothetical protein [Opitutus sp.]
MSSRGVKLVWGGAKQVPGRWRLGLWGVYEKPAGVRRMAISVRGLLGWGAGASVAVYLAGATALYFWFTRQPHNLVTWTDTLLMPVRWEHVRELRGRMMIAQGLEDLAAQRWAEAHMKLRVGLVRAPREVEGRRALADFYLLANRRADAIAVLTGDLASGYPGRTFLAKLFALAAEGEDFDLIIAACERFAGHADDREWLLGQRIGALLGAKRAEEALQLANTHPGEGGVAVKEGKALALLELGRAEEAAAFLETWAQGNREAAPQLAGLQARAYGQLKRWPEMDAALECVRQAAPLDPRSYLEAVVQTWRVGRETA